MKVSSKIVSGFLILMLLGLVVLFYQLSVIHQMQTVNRDLSEINMNSASIVLRLQKIAELLSEDCQKYFIDLDPVYDRQIAGFREDFQQSLGELQKTVRSPAEQE